jgi:hypothetical protein
MIIGPGAATTTEDSLRDGPCLAPGMRLHNPPVPDCPEGGRLRSGRTSGASIGAAIGSSLFIVKHGARSGHRGRRPCRSPRDFSLRRSQPSSSSKALRHSQFNHHCWRLAQTRRSLTGPYLPKGCLGSDHHVLLRSLGVPFDPDFEDPAEGSGAVFRIADAASDLAVAHSDEHVR